MGISSHNVFLSCLIVIEEIIAVTPILTGLIHAIININITVFSSPPLFTKTVIVIDQVITEPIVARVRLTFIYLDFTVRTCVTCKIVTIILDHSGAFNTTWYAVTNSWDAVLHTFPSIETGKPLTLLQRTQLCSYSGVWPQLIENRIRRKYILFDSSSLKKRFYLITFTTITSNDLFIIIFTNAIRTYADDFTTVLHMTLLREWHKIAIVTKALFRWFWTGGAGKSFEYLSPNPNCITIINTVFWALTKFAPKKYFKKSLRVY